MPKPSDSPAVQSYDAEKARQDFHSEDDLAAALKDTFPASDPVSRTHSSVSNVYTDGAERDEEYPLVDQALRSTGELGGDLEHGKLTALAHDASRLSDQASEVASGAVSMAKAEAHSTLRDIEGRIREHPLTALGIVAAIAYVWGATR